MTERPYNVVCTDEDPQWLQERTKYITASEMFTIAGDPPKWWSTTRAELLHQKRTRTQGDFKANRKMLWGSAAEEGNVDIFAKITGAKVRSCNVMLASKGRGRISCTLDGLLFAPKECPTEPTGMWSSDKAEMAFYRQFEGRGFGILEAKQSAGWKGQVDKWTVAPPDYYQSQVQVQLLVTGMPYAVIFCRLGVDDIRAHVILPDTFWQEEMIEAAEAFWKEVG